VVDVVASGGHYGNVDLFDSVVDYGAVVVNDNASRLVVLVADGRVSVTTGEAEEQKEGSDQDGEGVVVFHAGVESKRWAKRARDEERIPRWMQAMDLRRSDSLESPREAGLNLSSREDRAALCRGPEAQEGVAAMRGEEGG
jgi:hypothetical protein